MFVLCADKTRLKMTGREPMTSGSVNVYPVRFQFSADWDGLAKTAHFRAGEETVSVLLDDSNECAVPAEVLRHPGIRLQAGVCGRCGGELVLPTVWTDLGVILEGAVCPASVPPTPELWEQELECKGDRLGYTDEGGLGLYAGDKLLSAVPIEGSGERADIATNAEVNQMLDEVFSRGT